MWKKMGKGALQFLVVFGGFVVVLSFIVAMRDNAGAQGAAVSIGYVDMQEIMRIHPQTELSLAELRKFAEAQNEVMGRELEAKAREILGDKASIDQLPEDKQVELLMLREQMNEQFNMTVQEKDSNLTAPIIRDIIRASKAVAERKGLSMVLDSAAVLVGGTDLTQDVINEITKR